MIEVRVIPRAQKTEFSGERDGRMVVRLAAPPVDGAANDALIAFLAQALGVPKRSVTVVGGEKSRDKRVRIDGLDEAAARAVLLR